MLTKINRQKTIESFPILPLRNYDKKTDEEVFSAPKVFANYVLTLPSKSYKGNQKLLGSQITFLVKSLGFDHLIFLGDIDIPWLKRFDTYQSFQPELQYLASNKIGKRFNGGLKVNTYELPTFIANLTWLVRTNGIVQYVYFTDPAQNILANICQYGNLHISTKTKKADKLIKDIVAKSQFTFLTPANCSNRFSKNNSIKGRTIII